MNKKTILSLLPVTVISNRCRAVFLSFFSAIFCSSEAFLCFQPSLVSVHFAGPSLHVVNLPKIFFTPSSLMLYPFPDYACNVPWYRASHSWLLKSLHGNAIYPWRHCMCCENCCGCMDLHNCTLDNYKCTILSALMKMTSYMSFAIKCYLINILN